MNATKGCKLLLPVFPLPLVDVSDVDLSLEVSLIHLTDECLVAVVRILGLGLHVALSMILLLSHLLLLLQVHLLLVQLLAGLVQLIAVIGSDALPFLTGPLTRPRVLALAEVLVLLALSQASLASFALLRGPLVGRA